MTPCHCDGNWQLASPRSSVGVNERLALLTWRRYQWLPVDLRGPELNQRQWKILTLAKGVMDKAPRTAGDYLFTLGLPSSMLLDGAGTNSISEYLEQRQHTERPNGHGNGPC
jgi:hypothetical protein